VEEHYYIVTNGEDRNFVFTHVVSFKPLITPSVVEVTKERFIKDMDRLDFMVWFNDIGKTCFGLNDLKEQVLIFKLSGMQ